MDIKGLTGACLNRSIELNTSALRAETTAQKDIILAKMSWYQKLAKQETPEDILRVLVEFTKVSSTSIRMEMRAYLFQYLYLEERNHVLERYEEEVNVPN